MQRLVALVVVVSSLAVGARSRPAAANIAAPPPPAEVTGLGTAGGQSPLTVRAAELLIDCSAGGTACRLEVSYELHNPTAAPAGGTAAFYALATDGVTITVDGQPAGRPLTAADVAGFDAAVEAGSAGTAGPEMANRADELSRHGFDLALAPGASARVAVSAVIHAQGRRGYYLAVPAGPARHRLFARGDSHAQQVRLRYLVAPIRTWAEVPAEMGFTLKHPVGWTSTVTGATGLDQQDAGGVSVRHGRIATREPLLEVDLEVPRRAPVQAGLLLGIGGNVDDATGVRLRAGIEVGLREDYLASVVVEVERGAAAGVVVVPAAAIASPWMVIIPSVGLGVGVPVRLRPTLEVGGRVLVDAHLGPLGMVMALDYYPGMSAGPRRFGVALFGQLAL